MEVDVVPASEAEKPVIRRLLELNAHDFSEIDGRDLGPHGEFGYPYLDHYWIDPDRYPFLIRYGDQLAGFVLVRAGDPHQVAEFFVLRKYRVDAPPTVRLARGLRRDGESHRQLWLNWMALEDEFFARDQARARADLVVCGSPAVLTDPAAEVIVECTPTSLE